MNLNLLIFLRCLLFIVSFICILRYRRGYGYPACVGILLGIDRWSRGILVILLVFGLVILDYYRCRRYLL
jgi:hypothetical protein